MCVFGRVYADGPASCGKPLRSSRMIDCVYQIANKVHKHNVGNLFRVNLCFIYSGLIDKYKLCILYSIRKVNQPNFMYI